VTVAILIYAALSLVIGGAAATYEIWHRPVMLDRADGSGKFLSPKMSPGELVFFGLFVAIFWPLFAVATIADAWSARR
jgi:hypothetical protein